MGDICFKIYQKEYLKNKQNLAEAFGNKNS
jgi:hypothetical protein